MATDRKRTGRPTKRAIPGTRVSLGLKVTPAIKDRLDQSAMASGRTQSQEAELRLERSFGREDLLPETLALAYGHEAGGLLFAAGMVMTKVGVTAAHELSIRSRSGPRNWLDDPYSYDQAGRALVDFVDRARPPGDPTTIAIRQEVSDARPLLYSSELARAIDGKNKASWAVAIFGQRNIEAIRSMLGSVVGRLRLDGPGMVSHNRGGHDER